MISAFLAAAAAAVLCSCAGTVENEAERLPELVIGSEEYDPYNFISESGEHAGIDVELAQEACRRIGRKAVFREIDRNEIKDCLARGEVDCLWGCIPMNGAEDEYLWVGPYMNSRQMAAVRKNSDIYLISELSGRRVAVQSGSEPEELFRAQPEGIPRVEGLYSFADKNNCFAALRKGYVDAFAGHEAMLLRSIADSGEEFRMIGESLMDVQLGVAFSKDGDEALAEELSGALAEMIADGTAAQIAAKYGLDPDMVLGGISLEAE